MQIDIKKLRSLSALYKDSKEEHKENCQTIIDTAKFLGCDQPKGQEDVRVSLAYCVGFLAGLGHARGEK